jgi:RecG-like helicase
MSTGEFTEAACWGGHAVARKIADAEPRRRVVVAGVVCSTRVTAEGSTSSYECQLDDGTGEIGLLFLGRRSVAGMVVGTRCTIEGTVIVDGGRLRVWNPLYRIEASCD